MDINITAWPELLFKYGPYAVLALFVLWVTPRASKGMQELTKKAPKPVRVSATATLIVSWGVVLVMVAYVLFQWSPVRVYRGGLGVLKHSEIIYPLNSDVYVKMYPTQAPDHYIWRFVLVDNERNVDKNGTVQFSFFWGKNQNQYTDYVIPIAAILDGETKDFALSKREPGALYTWKDGNWTLATAGTAPAATAFNWHWQVYADDKLNEIAAQLSAPNRLFRAQARMKMRELTIKELEQLKELAKDADARHEIELELERRQR